MENDTNTEGVVEESIPLQEEGTEGENVDGIEGVEGGEISKGVEGDKTAGTEEVEGEEAKGEGLQDEHAEGVLVEVMEEGEPVEGEQLEGEEKEKVKGEELMGEEQDGDKVEGEETAKQDTYVPEEVVEEEEQYVEEPPPDPAAPYDFSDSKEAMKAPFELRPDQLAEVEQLWEIYQNYTPAYSEIDGYITEKELIYMLKSLLLMPFTIEQLQELVAYCCRPPHPKGHIFYEEFLKMVTIRQRDFPVEEEIRSALQVYDREETGLLDREILKDMLSKRGHKMGPKLLENLIKEVDMSNDGTIGIEDVVATMCLDLNKEDIQMLRATVYPPKEVAETEEDEIF